MTNIYEAIKESHEIQRSLGKDMTSKDATPQERKQAFLELAIELDAHASAEERKFYIPLQQHDEGLTQSRHAISEHHEAEEMVEAYVAAGYAKIHLDTSMACGNEGILSLETAAERSAQLCLRAEMTARANHLTNFPLYVIGAEVPSPGGMTADQKVSSPVTHVNYAKQTLQSHYAAFSQYGLEDAFERIIAMVVSSGAEFNDKQVFPYDSSKTKAEFGRIEKGIPNSRTSCIGNSSEKSASNTSFNLILPSFLKFIVSNACSPIDKRKVLV